MNENKINFDSLVSQIEYTNEALQNNARLVINRHVTAKAWLTGYYIVEYEQNGSDRAKYGEKLISELSKRLGKRNFSTTNLKIYRQFYLAYPMLLTEIGKFLVSYSSIGQSLTDLLQLSENQLYEKSQSLTDLSQPIAQSLIAQSDTIRQSPISQLQQPDNSSFASVPGRHYSLVEAVSNQVQSARYGEKIGHCLEGSTPFAMQGSAFQARGVDIPFIRQHLLRRCNRLLRYWLPARTEFAKVESDNQLIEKRQTMSAQFIC